MNGALVKVDSYEAALARLKAMGALPAIFEFEVDDHHLSGLSMTQAIRTRDSLMTLEREARALGYTRIDHEYNGPRNTWVYTFRRPLDAPAPKAQPALAADGVIDV